MDVTHRSFRLSAAKTSTALKTQIKTANAVNFLLKASPPIVGMTLDAHLVRGIEIDEVFILGTVCPMTAQALQSKVPVPRINDPRADGMRRMRLPFMARLADLENRSLLHQKQVVGTVRQMTFRALALRDRRVLCL